MGVRGEAATLAEQRAMSPLRMLELCIPSWAQGEDHCVNPSSLPGLLWPVGEQLGVGRGELGVVPALTAGCELTHVPPPGLADRIGAWVRPGKQDRFLGQLHPP